MGPMAQGGNAPVIIKRKKVIAGGGHHGGAWKVAYADFVTAMMAFFMLMWLLNATTEQQRKGIADYFAPVAPISRTSGGSDGMFGGDSPSSLDPMANTGEGLALGVVGDSSYPQFDDTDGTAAAAAVETATLEQVEDALLGRGGESLLSDSALRHVVTRLSDDGLVIEVFALPDAPIFDGATAEPLPVTREIVQTIATMASIVTNPVAIDAFVPSQPVVLADSPVWDLSSDRAGVLRRLMQDGGLDLVRLRRLTGHGDSSPATDNPLSERNDRFEITLLRTERQR